MLARTPAEVRALGIAAAQGRLPQALGEVVVKRVVSDKPRAVAPSVATRPSASGQARPARLARQSSKVDIERELKAGVSGFADEASLGLADHVLAAGNAVGEAVRDRKVADLVGDYQTSMTEKRAQDAYDTEHHGLARNTGRVLGFASTIAAMGAPGAARALLVTAPRARAAEQAARLGLRYGPDPRGLARLAAYGGAVSGVTDQVVSDVISGHTSSPLENMAAAGGGALGGLATRFAGPTAGGAVSSAATSALTDLARGRPVSWNDALDAAGPGAILGRFGGVVGEEYLRRLPSGQKGKIGDSLTDAKAWVRGDEILGRQRRVDLIPLGGKPEWTIADMVSTDRRTPMKVNEAKLGPGAELTDRQLQARNQFGDAYIVDFWRYSDVGKAGGAALSPYGAHFTDEHDRRRW